MKFATDAIQVSPKHGKAIIGWRQDLANLLPHAIDTVLHGQRVLVFQHAADEARLLVNRGIAGPAPILYQYNWAGGKPFESQKITAGVLTTNARVFVLSEPGCGKTRAVLYAFDFLRRTGAAKTMLVTSPLSTLEAVWENEVRAHFPHLTVRVVYGDADTRARLLASDADIYVINHDAMRNFGKLLLTRQFDVVTIDELTAFKNANAQRTKAMMAFTERANFVWGLTGTPTAQGPMDAHGQIRCVRPENAPVSAKRWQMMTMLQVSKFRWVPRANANEIVFNAMLPAVRFTREQVFELPPCFTVPRDTAMSAKQSKVFKMVLEKLRADLDDGTRITAVNAGVMLNKALQVASGFIYDANRNTHPLDPQPRLDSLVEVLADRRGKFLVFCPFTAGVNIIHDELTKRGFKVGKVTGATPAAVRNGLYARFQNPFASDEDEDGIVAHPRTMSHGLTLTEADMVVWAAPVNSVETYQQANARITRPGQTRKQMIVQLSGCALERRAYARLEAGISLQQNVLELFNEGETRE
jgi:SNF2 family DNA or RNA helicase